MHSLDDLCCLNSQCPKYGQRGAGNLRWHGWSGPKAHDIRLVYCRTCRTRFSERKGTALSQCRLPLEKAVVVLQHVAEGSGVRATSRLTGVHRDTISRLTKVAGEHAADLHEELVALSPSHRRGGI